MEQALADFAGAVSNAEHSAAGAASAGRGEGEAVAAALLALLSAELRDGQSAWDVLLGVAALPDVVAVDLECGASGEPSRIDVAAGGLGGGADPTVDPEGAAEARQWHLCRSEGLRDPVDFVRRSAPNMRGHHRAMALIRLLLQRRLLLAALETVAGVPHRSAALYNGGDPTRPPGEFTPGQGDGSFGVFGSADSLAMLLTAAAGIGGPPLRVRAAAAFFDVPEADLLNGALTASVAQAAVERSAAMGAATEAAERGPTDDETAVAAFGGLMNKVAQGRRVLVEFASDERANPGLLVDLGDALAFSSGGRAVAADPVADLVGSSSLGAAGTLQVRRRRARGGDGVGDDADSATVGGTRRVRRVRRSDKEPKPGKCAGGQHTGSGTPTEIATNLPSPSEPAAGFSPNTPNGNGNDQPPSEQPDGGTLPTPVAAPEADSGGSGSAGAPETASALLAQVAFSDEARAALAVAAEQHQAANSGLAELASFAEKAGDRRKAIATALEPWLLALERMAGQRLHARLRAMQAHERHIMEAHDCWWALVEASASS